MYQQSERPVFNARQVISPIHYDVINKKLNNIVFCLQSTFYFNRITKCRKREEKFEPLKNEMCFVRFYHYYSCREKLKEEYFLPPNFFAHR